MNELMERQTINYLAHYGILGMKWGKHNGPPYPIAPGNHSESEQRQAKSTVSTLASYVADRRRKKKEQKIVKKQEKAERKQIKAEEKFAKNKNEAIQSGSAKEILKFQTEMTNQELQYAIQRIDLTTRLNEAMVRQMPKKQKISVTKVLRDIGSFGSATAGVFVAAKSIKDAFKSLSGKDERLERAYQVAIMDGDIATAQAILKSLPASKASAVSNNVKNTLANYNTSKKDKDDAFSRNFCAATAFAIINKDGSTAMANLRHMKESEVTATLAMGDNIKKVQDFIDGKSDSLAPGKKKK